MLMADNPEDLQILVTQANKNLKYGLELIFSELKISETKLWSVADKRQKTCKYKYKWRNTRISNRFKFCIVRTSDNRWKKTRKKK